jgi:predicted class III extradiol MEMO1 family dioxygenase
MEIVLLIPYSYHRFSYTYYEEKHGAIHKSIEALDRMGMEIIETGDPVAFKEYLQEYENTICGRHPISVFLHVNGFLVNNLVNAYLLFYCLHSLHKSLFFRC